MKKGYIGVGGLQREIEKGVGVEEPNEEWWWILMAGSWGSNSNEESCCLYFFYSIVLLVMHLKILLKCRNLHEIYPHEIILVI